MKDDNMNFLTRGHLLILLAAAIGLAAAGCDGPVDEDLPKYKFSEQVKDQIAELNGELSAIKNRMDDKAAGLKARIEAQTELAEEQIENIRHNALARLEQATDPDQVEQIKETINNALNEATAAVEKARETLEDETSSDAMSPEEAARFQADSRDRLDVLRNRYDRAEQASGTVAGADKTRLTQALEMAEEAIDEAGSGLDKLRDAPLDQAGTIRATVESLFEKADANLKQAEDLIPS
jgi:hypothetical protein